MVVDDTPSSDEESGSSSEGSETDGSGTQSEHSEASDQHATTKRVDFDEEKLVSTFFSNDSIYKNNSFMASGFLL